MSTRSRAGVPSGRGKLSVERLGGGGGQRSSPAGGDGGGGHAVRDRHPSDGRKIAPLLPPPPPAGLLRWPPPPSTSSSAAPPPPKPRTASADSFSAQRLHLCDYDLFAPATRVRARLHLRRWRARELAAGRKPQLDMVGEVAALEIACRECGGIDLRRWLAPHLSSRTLAMIDRSKRRMPTAADGTESR